MERYLQTLSSQLEEAFLALPFLKDWHPDFARAARDTIFAGGKTVRPGLFLWALDSSEVKVFSLQERQLALSIEFVHASTLIKDDMPFMDNDDWRRGRPTSHRLYGEAFANLLSDVLLVGAFEIVNGSSLNAYEKEQFTKYLLRASGARGVYAGQWDDVRGDFHNLEELHRKKTGALFAATLCCAKVSSHNITESHLEKVWCEGESLGLLFQLIDDVLDETSTREALGKTPGKDRWLGKKTAISFWGLSKTQARIEELKKELSEYRVWVEFILERKK